MLFREFPIPTIDEILQDICTRRVIPRELHKRVIAIAHEGHVGARATKFHLRTKVWWSGIDKDIEKYVQAMDPNLLGDRKRWN